MISRDGHDGRHPSPLASPRVSTHLSLTRAYALFLERFMNKYTPECSSQFVNALQGGPGKACVKAAFVTGRVIVCGRRHIYTEHLVLKCAIPCRCRTAGSGTHFVTDYLRHMGLGEVSHEQPRPKNDILVSWPTRQPHALGRPAHVDYASLGFPKAAGIYLVMICRTRRSSLLKRRRVTVDCASLGVSRRRSRVPG